MSNYGAHPHGGQIDDLATGDDAFDVVVARAFRFRCNTCRQIADMHQMDDVLERVKCPACGLQVTGNEARCMYEELRSQYINECGRKVVLDFLRGAFPKAPRHVVGDEFADERWPFTLVTDYDDPDSVNLDQFI